MRILNSMRTPKPDQTVNTENFLKFVIINNRKEWDLVKYFILFEHGIILFFSLQFELFCLNKCHCSTKCLVFLFVLK